MGQGLCLPHHPYYSSVIFPGNRLLLLLGQVEQEDIGETRYRSDAEVGVEDRVLPVAADRRPRLEPVVVHRPGPVMRHPPLLAPVDLDQDHLVVPHPPLALPRARERLRRGRRV